MASKIRKLPVSPVIYDGIKTTDYYWTNFSGIKKKKKNSNQMFYISNLSVRNKKVWGFGSLVVENKEIKL